MMTSDNSELSQLDGSMNDDKVTIEVVYGVPHKQKILTLILSAGSTVEQAILESGVIALFPEIDLKVNKVGIWNRAVKLSEVVNDLDRIEVYRPLIADPKDVRKRRAEKAKLEGRADKTTGGRVNPLRVDANK
jgi:putative ubiquitin-RnfH superfamily antitoxin RatB of RatAB toxin-antitoxin module|tara:strand:+ start:42 stop:440 length:399 start_codon:yes stop_codon:yes gene_type:complete